MVTCWRTRSQRRSASRYAGISRSTGSGPTSSFLSGARRSKHCSLNWARGCITRCLAVSVLQAWRLQPLQPGVQRQVSIASEIPRALSFPWELLHDEQGFLVLRTRNPISLIRRLPQHELGGFQTSFEPPLRILMITARPDDAGFIDPRSTARELLDEVQQQVEAGAIALEFLRPPTLRAPRT